MKTQLKKLLKKITSMLIKIILMVKLFSVIYLTLELSAFIEYITLQGAEARNIFKTGLKFGYKNFALNFQYSYLSRQFTDSSNAVSGNLSGVIGEISSYEISDLALSYKFSNLNSPSLEKK